MCVKDHRGVHFTSLNENGTDNEPEGINNEENCLTAYMTFSQSTVHLVNTCNISFCITTVSTPYLNTHPHIITVRYCIVIVSNSDRRDPHQSLSLSSWYFAFALIEAIH